MNLETEIWKMIDGEIVELKIEEDTIFVRKTSSGTITKPSNILSPVETKNNNGNGGSLVFKRKQETSKHNTKMAYLEKWIQNNNFSVFTLDQFFKVYPKQRSNKKLDSVISRLIVEKQIVQLGKNKFRVVV